MTRPGSERKWTCPGVYPGKPKVRPSRPGAGWVLVMPGTGEGALLSLQAQDQAKQRQQGLRRALGGGGKPRGPCVPGWCVKGARFKFRMHNSMPDNLEDGIPCRSQVTHAGRAAALAAASQRAWPSLLPETTPQPARSRGQLLGDHPTASEEPRTASRRRPAGNGGHHVTTCKGLDPPNHRRNLLPPRLSFQTQPSLLPPDCEAAEVCCFRLVVGLRCSKCWPHHTEDLLS